MSNDKLLNAIEDKKVHPVVTVRNFLEKNKNQLTMALPKHLNADRMIRLACTEISKNPALLDCDQKSLFGAIVQSSQLGLEVGVLGQAYLIPFNNKSTGKKECQFIPGYQGLLTLIRRSGEITSIETQIVYKNDYFKMQLGLDKKVEHEPCLDGENGQRGDERLVYGVAEFKGGGKHFEWMSVYEVNQIMQKSPSFKSASSPWKTDFGQMMRKTLIRRMSKYLPMSIELQQAIQIMDAAEQGKNAFIENGVVITSDTEELLDSKQLEVTQAA